MRAAFFNAETQSRRERLFPLRLCASALYSPLRLCVSALFISIAAHAAPVEYRWHAESERTVAPDIPAWQGETVRLIPTFRSRAAAIDLSGDTFAFYWQTNGMGTAWWSVPAAAGAAAGTVVATWSPTNDVGARAYTFFIASTSASGTSYRAHGRLLMRPAPGATPSVLAAPTTLTDAMQAWADARYDPAGSAQTVSNALASGAALGATALQPSWAATGHVDTAGYAEAATSAFSSDWAAEATYAHDAGRAIALDSASPDGLALAAATAHADSPAAHPDIRAAIDAATNALAGNIMGGDLPVQRWKMFDFGVSSNRWLILTNDVLEIWEQ